MFESQSPEESPKSRAGPGQPQASAPPEPPAPNANVGSLQMPSLLKVPFSASARQLIAEVALQETLGTADQDLARYLSDFSWRASLMHSLSLIHPLNGARSESSMCNLLLIEADLRLAERTDDPLFHLQFGEFALDVASASSTHDIEWARERGAEMLLSLVDTHEECLHQAFHKAARAREGKLAVPTDVLTIIALRPSDVIEATRQIRSILLQAAA